MHAMGLVIYIQFQGVLDLRHATQMHDVKNMTEITRYACLGILFRKVQESHYLNISNYIL